MKLRVGMKVRIKKYDELPPFWNSKGMMNHWMGQVVTIKSIGIRSVQIREDNQGWLFQADNFEPFVDTLLEDDLFEI